MGLYDIPLSMTLFDFRMGTMLGKLHMCGILLLLISVLNMLVRKASPRRTMCFRCLMFIFFRTL